MRKVHRIYTTVHMAQTLMVVLHAESIGESLCQDFPCDYAIQTSAAVHPLRQI
jgi:hypothetical protein